MFHGDVDAGAAVSGEVSDAKGAHKRTDVFGYDFRFDTIGLGVGSGGGKEAHQQGGEQQERRTSHG